MNTHEKHLSIIERTLDEVLPAAGSRPAVLADAIRWAAMSGGKRIRPLVCLAAAEAVGGSAEDAAYPAAAIEILHNYTLVHDDLPAMDDDELRRGRPTVWARFGEDNAILAGDAMQALAFRVAARAPRRVPEIVAALGDAGVGVVRGQVEDLRREASESGASVVPSENIGFVYRHKTADLFVAAAVMGGLAGGGRDGEIDALGRFALNLGLAFQYEDDLLDGDSPWPRGETERRVREATDLAVAALGELGGDTEPLASIARRLVGRTV